MLSMSVNSKSISGGTRVTTKRTTKCGWHVMWFNMVSNDILHWVHIFTICALIHNLPILSWCFIVLGVKLLKMWICGTFIQIKSYNLLLIQRVLGMVSLSMNFQSISCWNMFPTILTCKPSSVNMFWLNVYFDTCLDFRRILTIWAFIWPIPKLEKFWIH